MAQALLANVEPTVLWQAQPGPQSALLACPIFEVFYGGARGGGKTDGLLGEWIKHAHEYGSGAKGLMIRREGIQLEDTIARSIELFTSLGWTYNATTKFWTSGSGAVLRFRHLWDEAVAESYLGHAYTRLYTEELPNWPTPKAILKMLGTLRSAQGVPVGMRGTGNPGGVGHNWVKARYIDPAIPYTPIQDPETKQLRVFIPARLEDNPALRSKDPEYESRLRLTGGPELYRAWRFGDWNIVAGGALDDVLREEIHFIRPFEIPKGWRIDRSFDWGSSKPFAVLWWAESDGNPAKRGDQEIHWKKGTLVCIAEWYGWNGQANEGVRMLAAEIARGVLEREKAIGIQGRVKAGPADSSIFVKENGRSIGEDMGQVGVHWEPADKKPGSRVSGLEAVRKRLKAGLVAHQNGQPIEEPGLFFFNTCLQCKRTLGTLPRDPKKMDDVDTESEEHLYDAVRYRVQFGGDGVATVPRFW